MLSRCVIDLESDRGATRLAEASAAVAQLLELLLQLDMHALLT